MSYLDERWEPIHRLSEHASAFADEEEEQADASTDVFFFTLFVISPIISFRK